MAGTGSIYGKVMTMEGEPLPGATVMVFNSQSGSRETHSDARGGYEFIEAPSGEYTVQAELEGFGTCEKKGVQVTPGSSTEVDCHLSLSLPKEP